MPNGPFDQNPQQMPDPRMQGMHEVPAGMLEDEEGSLDIRRYVNALMRHKWMILGLGALGLVVGLVASRTVEPVYQTVATIQLPPSRYTEQQTPIRTSQAIETPAGWVELLTSFRVMDEVVKRRRLYIRPVRSEHKRYFANFDITEDFSPGTYVLKVSAEGDRMTLTIKDGATVDERAVGDSVGTALGFLWVPQNLAKGDEVEFRLISPRDIAGALSEDLIVPTPKPDATFLSIALKGTDPVSITATLNAVAERFVEVSRSMSSDRSSQSTERLRTQLDAAQAEVRDADNALESFRIGTLTMGNDAGQSSLGAGQQAFVRTRLDRDSLSFEKDAIDKAIRNSSDTSSSLLIMLGSIPSARTSPELSASLDLLGRKRVEAREMRLTYGPAHEPLRQLDREIAELESRTIPSQARAVSAQLERRIRDLDGRLSASSREMQQVPARVSEEARLQRRVMVASALYTQLQSAYDQAQLAEMGGTVGVRLLDAARVPTVPMADQIRTIILGGLFGGLALGIAIALLLDRFDKRIRYPDQVTRELGLTILGTLPMMRTGKKGEVNPDFAAQLLESMRGIRMNLSYAHGTAGTFVTAVTSPGPGDGKSFTSANLARAFAAAGRRTILIDADTRRGLQHRTFGVDRRPGLIDMLDGSVPREQVVRPLPEWGFDFVSCGTRKSGGPELLASPIMQQFILALRSEYQAIVIDCPPLGAGVDPLVLASLAGTMVIVLRTGVTDRDLAGAHLGDLGRLPIRLLGAILNDVKQEGHYKYYGYLPGYRAEDEADEEPKVYTPDAPGKTKRLSRGD